MAAVTLHLGTCISWLGTPNKAAEVCFNPSLGFSQNLGNNFHGPASDDSMKMHAYKTFKVLRRG